MGILLAVWPVVRLLLLVLCLAVSALCLALLAIFLPDASGLDLSILDREVIVVILVAVAFAAAALRLWTWPKSPAWRRIALVVVTALAASPFVGLAWFDASWFYPRLQQVRARVTDPALGSDPRLSTLIESSEGRSLQQIVTRMIQYQSGMEPPGHSSYQLNGLFSNWLVGLHCDRTEQRTLFASLIYTGEGSYGLQAAAQRMYGHELSELDADQLSTIVAVARRPSLEKHPEELAKRAKLLRQSLPDAR